MTGFPSYLACSVENPASPTKGILFFLVALEICIVIPPDRYSTSPGG